MVGLSGASIMACVWMLAGCRGRALITREEAQYDVTQYAGCNRAKHNPQPVIHGEIGAALLECQGADKQAHGETDPAQCGDAVQLQLTDVLGHL